jgi:hypothetical protein
MVGALAGSLIAFVTFKFILTWHRYSIRFLPYTIPSSEHSAMNGFHRRPNEVDVPFQF